MLCLGLGLAACGDSDDDGGSSATAAAGASTTAAASEGVDLKVGQFSWTAAAVQTQILAAIAADHPELGVKSISAVRLDPAAGWVGIQRGDVDLLPEVNLPNQQAFADRARGEVELAAKVYDGAVQAWFVPRYAVEAGGPLDGLRSIDQLNDYKGEVNDTLYDGDAGWITTQQNEKRIKGYDLDLRHAKSSEAALIAQVRRSYDKREPVLFFFYRPHWLFQQFDVVQLEEPNPYRAGCFEGDENQCAIPAQRVVDRRPQRPRRARPEIRRRRQKRADPAGGDRVAARPGRLQKSGPGRRRQTVGGRATERRSMRG